MDKLLRSDGADCFYGKVYVETVDECFPQDVQKSVERSALFCVQKAGKTLIRLDKMPVEKSLENGG